MEYFRDEREIALYSPHLIELIRAVHEKSKSFRFKAKGFSMSPFVKDGDVLTIDKHNDSYNFGDLAAFVRPCVQKLVVHRIVGKKNNLYLLKGDNIFKNDGFVPFSNMLGKVVKVDRGGRNILFGVENVCGPIAFMSRYNFFPVLFFFPRLLNRLVRRIKGE